jgi:hypothetical protein
MYHRCGIGKGYFRYSETCFAALYLHRKVKRAGEQISHYKFKNSGGCMIIKMKSVYNLTVAIIFACTLLSCGGDSSPTKTSPSVETYSVTYNDNGSTGGSVPSDSNTYTSGQTVTISANSGNLTRTDYILNEWNTAADGSGTAYTMSSTMTMPEANVILYAQWKFRWQSLGGGMNAKVWSVIADGSGNVYAAGDFTTAGGVSANHIAKWNGTAWSALGTGTGGSVYGMTFDASGNLYVTGVFTVAGGVTVHNLAKWNGSAWSAVSSDYVARTSGQLVPSGVAFDKSGNLLVIGAFDTVGALTVNNIAKLSGTQWSALGTGTNGSVYTVTSDSSNNYYMGGIFTTAGGASISNLSKWNGTAWSSLGTFTNGSSVDFLSFDSAGKLYMGGNFTAINGVSAKYAAIWDGTTWTAAGDGFNGTVRSISFGSTNVYFGGYFTKTGSGTTANYLAVWDGGSTVKPLDSGVSGNVERTAIDSSGNLYMCGEFLKAGGISVNYIAKYLN